MGIVLGSGVGGAEGIYHGQMAVRCSERGRGSAPENGAEPTHLLQGK